MTTNERIKEIAEKASAVLYLDIGLVDAVEFHNKTTALIEQAIIEATKDLSATIEVQKNKIEELRLINKNSLKQHHFEELKSALRLAHDKMSNWYSSEYAEHPDTMKVRKILYGDSAISKQRNEL